MAQRSRIAAACLFTLLAACSQPSSDPAPAAPEPQAEAASTWTAVGNTAAYTDPEMGVFRVACDGADVAISGPSGVSQTTRPETVVVFSAGGQATDRDAMLDFGPGGPRFVAKLAPDDPAVAALLAGLDVMVIHGLAKWTVPGADAPQVLRPVLAACASG